MADLVKFKSLLKLGIADIGGTAITAVFWFFLASMIKPSEYGEISYYIAIAALAAAFVGIGTTNTISVYVSKNIKIESTLYFLSLVLSIVASFIIIITFYKIDVVFLIFGFVIHALATGEIIGKKAFFTYTKFTLIQKIGTLVLGLLFYWIMGVEGILYALAISYAIFSIIIIKQFRNSKVDFKLLKNRTQFIFENYIHRIVDRARTNLYEIIIVPILGFAILGNFSLAMQFVSLAFLGSAVVFKYTLPDDARGEKNRRLKFYTIILSISLTIIGIITLPIVLPVFFPEYTEIVDPIKIIIISVIPLTITNIFMSEYLGNEKSRRILISRLISLSTFIILTIVLGSEFGITGLTVAYLISVTVETICLIPTSKLRNHKKWEIN